MQRLNAVQLMCTDGLLGWQQSRLRSSASPKDDFLYCRFLRFMRSLSRSASPSPFSPLPPHADVVGVATTNGAEALLDALPYQDATMIKQVKDAGAIILAKTNLAEWAFSNQKSLGSVFGTTRNPYDLNRVTTGSSGGTAAGVCASLGMIGFGTDTGNSIRGPSSAQGLVGIRSTIGATSRAGIAPLRLSRE